MLYPFKIVAIVAVSLDNKIGYENALLWHLPKDLTYFQHITWGQPVIMGRKTYQSIGKPLKGRLNIVISRNNENYVDIEGKLHFVHSKEQALAKANDAKTHVVYIIGGREIYLLFQDLYTIKYITLVEAKFKKGIEFIRWNKKQWKKISEEKHIKDSQHPHSFSFQKWTKTLLE